MSTLYKLSVNISAAYAKRLRKLRHMHGLSASSLVEAALAAYFEEKTDAAVAQIAREAGATLRREPQRK